MKAVSGVGNGISMKTYRGCQSKYDIDETEDCKHHTTGYEGACRSQVDCGRPQGQNPFDIVVAGVVVYPQDIARKGNDDEGDKESDKSNGKAHPVKDFGMQMVSLGQGIIGGVGGRCLAGCTIGGLERGETEDGKMRPLLTFGSLLRRSGRIEMVKRHDEWK